MSQPCNLPFGVQGSMDMGCGCRVPGSPVAGGVGRCDHHPWTDLAGTASPGDPPGTRGFDENDPFADVPFTVHTRTGMRISVLDVMSNGEDSNTEGGSMAGLVASLGYDFGGTLTAREPEYSVECDPPATSATSLTPVAKT
jgi:hypothetical protein